MLVQSRSANSEAVQNTDNMHRELKGWFHNNKVGSRTKSFIRSFWNETDKMISGYGPP